MNGTERVACAHLVYMLYVGVVQSENWAMVRGGLVPSARLSPAMRMDECVCVCVNSVCLSTLMAHTKYTSIL